MLPSDPNTASMNEVSNSRETVPNQKPTRKNATRPIPIQTMIVRRALPERSASMRIP